jgi:hypothetical protein
MCLRACDGGVVVCNGIISHDRSFEKEESVAIQVWLGRERKSSVGLRSSLLLGR